MNRSANAPINFIRSALLVSGVSPNPLNIAYSECFRYVLRFEEFNATTLKFAFNAPPAAAAALVQDFVNYLRDLVLVLG